MEDSLFTSDVSCNISTIAENSDRPCLKKRLVPRKVLKNQLQEAQSKNFQLENALATKESEIQDLRKSVNSLNDIINAAQLDDVGKGSTIASSEISKLSRKIRHLTAEFELYKSKYESEHSKLLKLEAHMGKNKEPEKKESKEQTRKISSNVEMLQEQLQSSKQKISELRNQNTELKNNLKLAQKCIQQEIGENFNINILAQSTPTWRGRAQQIIALQNKISELKERVDGKGSEEVFKQQVREIDAKKKADFEELTRKIEQLQATIEDQKIKINALKIRNKNLSDDAMNYKLKTLNLMEKTGENDNSMAVVRENMSIQKFQYEHKIKKLNTEIEKLSDEIRNEKLEHSRTKAEMGNLNRCLEERDAKAQELYDIIKSQENEMREMCGEFLFSCRGLKKEEFLALLEALETEKKGLIDHNNSLKGRLEVEREKVQNMTEQSSRQKLKIARLEAKIRDIQKEQDMQQDKRRRTQRIADYANNLPTRLSTLCIENTNACVAISQRSEPELQTSKLKIEELSDSLALANEKIAFLEEKLHRVKNEKEQDVNMFAGMVYNTKQVLLDSIKKHRKTVVEDVAEKSCESLDVRTVPSIGAPHPSYATSFAL